MTNETEARAKVRAFLPTDEFDLEAFPEGWLVVRRFREPRMGAATFAVERSTGTLWEFPSHVPPSRVMESFEAIKSLGRAVHPASE